jgi:hypothetical protein
MTKAEAKAKEISCFEVLDVIRLEFLKFLLHIFGHQKPSIRIRISIHYSAKILDTEWIGPGICLNASSKTFVLGTVRILYFGLK